MEMMTAMIHVNRLTKYYGDHAAVQDVSFDVPAGKIVGFLGPNGAGKSTTMRILTGYLTATSGSATIAGLDVFWDSIEVRRRIGYMPENCPLYPDMRVSEYLKFRAGLKGLGGHALRARIDYVVERCWIQEVSRQLIGTLSKGYRQRVGLADVLLASPPVLILDEPTAGLDPTQIRSTRGLIRELGQEHTVLLSTHILSEVEMTCDRVIIIHRGRVVAADSLENLSQQQGEKTSLVATFDGFVDPAAFEALPGVTSFAPESAPGGYKLRFLAADMAEVGARITQVAAARNFRLRELRQERPSLEEMFVEIVGRDEVPA